MNDEERLQTLTSLKLDTEHVWHFCSKNDWNSFALFLNWLYQLSFRHKAHTQYRVDSSPKHTLMSAILLSILLWNFFCHTFPSWAVRSHWSSSSESLWCIWSLTPEVYFALERQIQLSWLVAPRGYSPPANNPIDSHYGSRLNSIKCALTLKCVALNTDVVGLVQTCNVLAKMELIPLRLFLVSKHYLPRCDFARVHKPLSNHAWVDTVYWICVTFYKQERTFSWIPAPGYCLLINTVDLRQPWGIKVLI